MTPGGSIIYTKAMDLIVALYLLFLWAWGSFRSLADLLRALTVTSIVFSVLWAGSLFYHGKTAFGVLALIAPFAAGYLLILLADALRNMSARQGSAV